MVPLQWRHNGPDSVWNHQPHDCLLNRLFRRRSEKSSKLRVTGLCAGNPPWTGEFPAQMASNVKMFYLMTSSCDKLAWQPSLRRSEKYVTLLSQDDNWGSRLVNKKNNFVRLPELYRDDILSIHVYWINVVFLLQASSERRNAFHFQYNANICIGSPLQMWHGDVVRVSYCIPI